MHYLIEKIRISKVKMRKVRFNIEFRNLIIFSFALVIPFALRNKRPLLEKVDQISNKFSGKNTR
jgi:hypothetical protein